MLGLLIFLAIIVLLIAALWKAFQKAGQPGWACIVPIYNMIIMCKMAGKPAWWVLLMFIPIVSIVIAIMLNNEISKRFGFGIGMTLLLTLLPIIGWPIIGFGDAKYADAPAAG